MMWERFALIYGQSVFSVSDAVTLQNEWTFARASRLATSLFRKVKAFHTINSREFYYYLGFDFYFFSIF